MKDPIIKLIIKKGFEMKSNFVMTIRRLTLAII